MKRCSQLVEECQRFIGISVKAKKCWGPQRGFNNPDLFMVRSKPRIDDVPWAAP